MSSSSSSVAAEISAEHTYYIYAVTLVADDALLYIRSHYDNVTWRSEPRAKCICVCI